MSSPNPALASSSTSLSVRVLASTGESVEQAEVFLDGESLGLSPISVTSIEPGVHEILVEKAGFSRLRQAFIAQRGSPVQLDVKLKPIRLEPTTPLVSRESVTVAGPASSESMLSKWWFWAAVGGATVLVVGLVVASGGGDDFAAMGELGRSSTKDWDRIN